MSYISNSTRVSSLTVGGNDYTSQFVEWTASDSSANRNGCVQTSGQLILGARPGTDVLEDYDRNFFRRGVEVRLSIQEPGGAPVVHPRGLLYVISTSMNIESETLTVEIGCRLTLLALTETTEASKATIEQLIEGIDFEVDPAQRTFSNCCAGYATMGKFLYQDNGGSINELEYWEGDDTSGTAPGEWVSILGTTTSTATPLAGTSAIPDEIKLSYQVPSDGLDDDRQGTVETVTTDSYYFLQYPVVTWARVNSNATEENPNGTLQNAQAAISEARSYAGSASGASCGNTPNPPQPPGDSPPLGSCMEGYDLVQAPVYMPASRLVEQTTEYKGPAAQVSAITTATYGPRIEANNQYFADSFAFCRQVYSWACNPDGGCPYEGMDRIKLSEVKQVNEFGSANEIIKTTTTTYTTRLSGAQPTDWRAGVVGGEIREFNPSLKNATDLYRSRIVTTTYSQEENVNIQDTVTMTSLTSRQVGIGTGQNIDAAAGIKEQTIRKSATIATLDVQPDILNSPTTSTSERVEVINLFTDRYKVPPAEAGPYVVEEQIPLPILYDSIPVGDNFLFPEAQVEAVVDNYSNYVSRFTKGDAFGLAIGEGLRSEVLNNWHPNMPFRFYDPFKGKLLALRMDATVWGVSNTEAAFVTNGMWNGISNGSVTIPSNVLGAATPDMGADSNGPDGPSGGGTPGPSDPVVPPSVDDETSVDSGSFAFQVYVNLAFQAYAFTFTEDGIGPAPMPEQTANVNRTMSAYVSGLVATSGSLLATDGNGDIPLEYNGNLVTATGTVLNADLFADP